MIPEYQNRKDCLRLLCITFIEAQTHVDQLNIADQFLIADESESAVRRVSAAEMRTRLIPQAEALFNAIKGFLEALVRLL